MKSISMPDSAAPRRLARSLCVIALLLPFLTGCDMDMSDQMIKEMETAYPTALQTRSDADKARIEAIKREQARSFAAGEKIIAGLDYAGIARTLAEREEIKEAVNRAVQKYFPPGMKAEEAFKRLRQMKEQGFEISETRYDSARAWPDGEFKFYLGEVGKLTHQRRYPQGMSEFIAQKQYGIVIRFLATKHVVISFRVVDGSGVISEVEGTAWIDAI